MLSKEEYIKKQEKIENTKEIKMKDIRQVVHNTVIQALDEFFNKKE